MMIEDFDKDFFEADNKQKLLSSMMAEQGDHGFKNRGLMEDNEDNFSTIPTGLGQRKPIRRLKIMGPPKKL